MATTDHAVQTMLIRATPDRITQAITLPGDLEAWHGRVPSGPNAEPPGPVMPGVSSGFGDASFSFEERPGATLVSVASSAESVDTVSWPTELRYLQAWVESGRSRAVLNDPARFASVERVITVPASPAPAWRALLDADLMSQWLEAVVTCDPKIGGHIDIQWSDGSHIGGEIVLLDAPCHLITHWWDATSLAEHDDPGVITVMHWRVSPDPAGARIHLLDTGYDLDRVDNAWMEAINEGWDTFLTNLEALFHPGTGATT